MRRIGGVFRDRSDVCQGSVYIDRLAIVRARGSRIYPDMDDHPAKTAGDKQVADV